MKALSRALPVVLAVALVTGGARADVREVGQLVLDGIPEIPDRIKEKTAQYQNVRSASFADWAPDGGVLISTRFGETSQLHHVAEPGGARRQLTFYKDAVASASYGKSADWFLFNKDFGGNEASQIFRFNLKTGDETLLTDGENQNGSPLWSNAEDRIAWRSTARNSRDHDIWVMDPTDPESKHIGVEVEGYWFPLDWSPDDKKLLVGNYVSAALSFLWVVDLESGERTPVGRQGTEDDPIAYAGGVFDASGKGVYFISDEGAEHRRLRWTEPGSTDFKEITDDIDWSVIGITPDEDRKRMAFLVNEGGSYRAYMLNAKSGKYRALNTPLGLLTGLSFSPDGDHLSMAINSPASPSDVYSLNLKNEELTRWTQSEVGGLDTENFVTSEIIHYPTFDKDENGDTRMIPAFIYRPRGEGPFPVVVRIHGGPESQAQAWFSYTSQYEANELGCAVIYPNVRGSSGFGKTYLQLDNGFKREDSVKDIGALLDWIAEQPDLDETRVGVTGGSYGGYMVLACMMHYSDRLKCGIESVGISNFVTFLENTADYRRDLRRVEYGDERDPEMYEFLQKISPTNNVDLMEVPLMVIQGANDPRVPASEAEQIVEAVRAKGKNAWYMLAKDEGHGFRKKSNRDWSLWATALFWETYLLGDGTEMSAAH
ncbi:MAG: S9 family peptidase [Gemmatimonadetes bacterium]|nr:S9 family peptidase [Gemmatimonadota bacterium]